MDRRQLKTRKAIFEAFSRLLEKKSYSHITVQNIIDEANIGRSTFYAHFETRDELLNAVCGQIFDHIFSNVLLAEAHHDFSKENYTLVARLTHLLHHLQESKKEILPFLTGESSELFLRYFKLHLIELFERYTGSQFPEIPHDFVLNQYVSSFVQAVKWWAGQGMIIPPEDLVTYYLQLHQFESAPCKEAQPENG